MGRGDVFFNNYMYLYIYRKVFTTFAWQVSNWAQSHERKLREAFDKLRHQEALLDQLMAWLSGAEASLVSQEQVPVPDNVPIIEQLLHDHQTFEQDIQVRSRRLAASKRLTSHHLTPSYRIAVAGQTTGS